MVKNITSIVFTMFLFSTLFSQELKVEKNVFYLAKKTALKTNSMLLRNWHYKSHIHPIPNPKLKKRGNPNPEFYSAPHGPI